LAVRERNDVTVALEAAPGSAREPLAHRLDPTLGGFFRFNVEAVVTFLELRAALQEGGDRVLLDAALAQLADPDFVRGHELAGVLRLRHPLIVDAETAAANAAAEGYARADTALGVNALGADGGGAGDDVDESAGAGAGSDAPADSAAVANSSLMQRLLMADIDERAMAGDADAAADLAALHVLHGARPLRVAQRLDRRRRRRRRRAHDSRPAPRRDRHHAHGTPALASQRAGPAASGRKSRRPHPAGRRRLVDRAAARRRRRKRR
jgi:hypothetical protein